MKQVVLGLSAVLLGGAGIKVLRDRQYRKYLVDKFGAETFATDYYQKGGKFEDEYIIGRNLGRNDVAKTRTFVVSSVDYDTGQIDDLDLPQDFTFTLDEHDTAELEGSTDMQEIADLLVDNISDETGWLVDGFYFQEKMPDGTLVSLDAESFSADARELYRTDPQVLLELARKEGLECMYCDGSSFHTPYATPYSRATGGATIYYPCDCGETQVVITDKKWGAETFEAPKSLATQQWHSELAYVQRFIENLHDNYYSMIPEHLHNSLDKCYDIMNDVVKDSRKAETFEAPYGGADSLMDIGKETPLADFTDEELTTSSAIHGDFDQASLNYSGHQNLEVRAEDVDFYELDGDDYVSKMKEMYQDFLDNWDEEWPDGDNPPSFEEWADMFMEQNASLFYAETHAYTYAYNEGHSDSRKSKEYRPNLVADRDKADFKRILKQKGD